MSYARAVKIATLLSLLCVPACSETCPVETDVEPTVPAYENPCDGLEYVTTLYHDERNANFGPGGTVRANGTAGHLLHFEPGQVIESVRVRIVPRHHEGELPMFLPTLDVRKATEIGDGPAIYADDGLDTVEAYNKPHNLAVMPGWITEGGTDFYVGIGGESGPNALDFEICGTSVTLVQ